MADYWRYGDRMAPGQVPVKRLRAEFDDLAPAGAAYYPREELRYDDRDGRGMLREPESLGIGYGSGLTGADISGVTGGHLGLGGLGSTNLGLSTHDDHSLLGYGGGRMLGLESGIGKPSTLGINNGRPDYLPRQDSQGPPRPRVPLPHDASPTLFVEGLPSDCSRREAAHVFRPFYGFKEVRLVRKEGKRSGSDLVLCFVDFTDAQHAANAREALQGHLHCIIYNAAVFSLMPALGCKVDTVVSYTVYQKQFCLCLRLHCEVDSMTLLTMSKVFHIAVLLGIIQKFKDL